MLVFCTVEAPRLKSYWLHEGGRGLFVILWLFFLLVLFVCFILFTIDMKLILLWRKIVFTSISSWYSIRCVVNFPGLRCFFRAFMISILIEVAWFNDWKYYMFCLEIISISNNWMDKKSVTLAKVHWVIKYCNHLICTYVLISPTLCAQFHIYIWYTSLIKFSLLGGHFLWTSEK